MCVCVCVCVCVSKLNIVSLTKFGCGDVAVQLEINLLIPVLSTFHVPGSWLWTLYALIPFATVQ